MKPNETFEQSAHQELSDSHILGKIARVWKLSDATKQRVFALLKQKVLERDNLLSSLTAYLANTSEELLWAVIDNCHLLENLTQGHIQLLVFAYHLGWKNGVIDLILEKDEYSQELKKFLTESVVNVSQEQAQEFLEQKYQELLM